MILPNTNLGIATENNGVSQYKKKQAKGLGFMNQTQKDSHVDSNYKFAIYSLQLYAIVTLK